MSTNIVPGSPVSVPLVTVPPNSPAPSLVPSVTASPASSVSISASQSSSLPSVVVQKPSRVQTFVQETQPVSVPWNGRLISFLCTKVVFWSGIGGIVYGILNDDPDYVTWGSAAAVSTSLTMIANTYTLIRGTPEQARLNAKIHTISACNSVLKTHVPYVTAAEGEEQPHTQAEWKQRHSELLAQLSEAKRNCEGAQTKATRMASRMAKVAAANTVEQFEAAVKNEGDVKRDAEEEIFEESARKVANAGKAGSQTIAHMDTTAKAAKGLYESLEKSKNAEIDKLNASIEKLKAAAKPKEEEEEDDGKKVDKKEDSDNEGSDKENVTPAKPAKKSAAASAVAEEDEVDGAEGEDEDGAEGEVGENEDDDENASATSSQQVTAHDTTNHETTNHETTAHETTNHDENDG